MQRYKETKTERETEEERDVEHITNVTCKTYFKSTYIKLTDNL
jgi:hypothetical protein